MCLNILLLQCIPMTVRRRIKKLAHNTYSKGYVRPGHSKIIQFSTSLRYLLGSETLNRAPPDLA